MVVFCLAKHSCCHVACTTQCVLPLLCNVHMVNVWHGVKFTGTVWDTQCSVQDSCLSSNWKLSHSQVTHWNQFHSHLWTFSCNWQMFCLLEQMQDLLPGGNQDWQNELDFCSIEQWIHWSLIWVRSCKWSSMDSPRQKEWRLVIMRFIGTDHMNN